MGKIGILKSAAAAACAMALLATVAGCAAGGPDTKIQVTRASFGYAQGRKDVKDDVAKLCNDKSSCKFAVKVETFPSHPPADPSPGDDKSVLYGWKCGDVSEHSYETAEGKTANLSCPSDAPRSGCKPGMVACQATRLPAPAS